MTGLPAHRVSALLHVGLALALGAWFRSEVWGPFVLLLPAIAIATVGLRLVHGPCFGFAVVLVFLIQEIHLGFGSSRLSLDSLVGLGVLAPLYLSTGFRASAGARGHFAEVDDPELSAPDPTAASAVELTQILSVPLGLLGVALPLLAVLRRAGRHWNVVTFPFPENGSVFLYVWLALLGLVVLAGAASVLGFRRIGPLEARVHLLDAARETTAADEARIWRRLVRLRARRRSRPPLPTPSGRS